MYFNKKYIYNIIIEPRSVTRGVGFAFATTKTSNVAGGVSLKSCLYHSCLISLIICQ